MELVVRGCALAATGALLALFLRKYDGAVAALLSLACAAAVVWILAEVLRPVLEFLERLRQTAGIAPPVMAPLMKSVAIGLLVQSAAAVCADSGNSTLAGAVRLLGTGASIYLALPLLESVLTLVTEMMGE